MPRGWPGHHGHHQPAPEPHRPDFVLGGQLPDEPEQFFPGDDHRGASLSGLGGHPLLRTRREKVRPVQHPFWDRKRADGVGFEPTTDREPTESRDAAQRTGSHTPRLNDTERSDEADVIGGSHEEHDSFEK